LTPPARADTLAAEIGRGSVLDHVSLSDPLTWVGVLVAAFLIAGLRLLLRGGVRRPPHNDEPRD
jgi:hypothetical protein